MAEQLAGIKSEGTDDMRRYLGFASKSQRRGSCEGGTNRSGKVMGSWLLGPGGGYTGIHYTIFPKWIWQTSSVIKYYLKSLYK